MNYNVDDRGFYGEFGGAYIPELMYPNIKELRDNYIEIIRNEDFRNEFSVTPQRLCRQAVST